MKKVRTTHRTFVFTTFFTLWRKQFLGPLGDRANRRGKVTVEKTPKRAGATPLFGLPAAQKVRGVAPALRHGNSCRMFFHGDRRVCRQQSLRAHASRTRMPDRKIKWQFSKSSPLWSPHCLVRLSEKMYWYQDFFLLFPVWMFPR